MTRPDSGLVTLEHPEHSELDPNEQSTHRALAETMLRAPYLETLDLGPGDDGEYSFETVEAPFERFEVSETWLGFDTSGSATAQMALRPPIGLATGQNQAPAPWRVPAHRPDAPEKVRAPPIIVGTPERLPSRTTLLTPEFDSGSIWTEPPTKFERGIVVAALFLAAILVGVVIGFSNTIPSIEAKTPPTITVVE